MISRRKPHNAGFTLIELVVVIVIVGILAAVIVPRFLSRTEDAKRSSAVTAISSFRLAIDLYSADNGKVPTSEQGLQALISPPSTAKKQENYLKDVTVVPKDPWQNDYVYKAPGENGRDYEIISPGPNGKIDGTGKESDDVQSWDLQK